MKKLIDQIDFKSGSVTYSEIHLDFEQSLEEQEDELQEDMLQVHYPMGYILDVGWCGEAPADGFFRVVVIKNKDRWSPVFDEKVRNIYQLIEVIKKCIDKIERLISQEMCKYFRL